MSNACWGVIPAAGSGSRMAADRPKQYLEVAGRPLLEHSLGALLSHPAISGVTVALQPDDPFAPEVPLLNDPRVDRVAGAAERSGSVLAALAGLAERADPDDWVLVHDAARPCLGAAELDRLLAAVLDAGCGGLLAQPVVDTLKRAGPGNRVASTVDRNELWRAQTPQMFRLGELREALAAALAAGVAVTDEASAMEWAGHPVQLVRGSPANLKVTVAEDLALAAWYLRERGAN
ncbi:MAG: 2-C-methyl-D-erythritol 4-phosphate cytidylyltransferase [Halioglobus sp.]|nr:2-C-methyl-D-erythritol 4-phosphate cytidylyltransferase [Halioglobus sp.]